MNLLVICTLVSLLSFVNGDTMYGQRLDGFVIKTIIQVSFEDCAKECHRRPACLSINYNSRFKICEPNSESPLEPVTILPTNILKLAKQWNFCAISNQNVLDIGKCYDNDCLIGQVCVDLDVGYECKNEGASPTTFEIDNGVVNGNMNDNGSKIAFECFASYVLDGPRISTYSEVTGWSEIPVCEIVCPVPSGILNSPILQITQAVIYYGNVLTVYPGPDYSSVSETPAIKTSNITFQCRSNPATSASMNLTCNAGNWDFKPDCSSGDLACDLETSCTNTIADNCINAICHCPLGTSYSYSLQLCVDRCPGDLATTFTKVNGIEMINDFDYDLFTGITAKQCLNNCLKTSTCLSYEYGTYDGEWSCYIRTVVVADYPNDMRDWSGGAFFQRDCV